MSHAQPRAVLLAVSASLSDRVLEIGAYLERFGFEVATAANETEVLSALGRAQVDAVVFDLGFVESVDVEVWLGKLRLISPQTAPLVLGEIARLEELRRVAQQADGEYALLPVNLSEIRRRLGRRLEPRPPAEGEPLASAEDRRGVEDLVGASPAMQAIRERIRKIAGLTSTVLITGDSGVGKELIARAIHRSSPRRDGAFIAVNCAALPEALLESELFGHEKGAFTGAAGLVRGKFELAHQGTLFLDEIGDMNPYMQAKILRVLEEKEFMRIGGSRNIRVDARLVAATNADLKKRMADGRFREDLYYRLKVLTIEVPPLRDRAEDVPELVRAFLDRFSRQNGLSPRRITDEALLVLSRYHWPGNIRELRNTLENMIATAPGAVIDLEDLPPGLSEEAAPARASAVRPGAPAGNGAVGSMEDMERELIRNALAEAGGNRTRAAQRLKIGVRTLQRKIKRFGLEETS